MKKIFTITALIAIAALLFAACRSNPDLDTQKNVVLTDTSGMYRSNASTDVSASSPTQQQQQTAPSRTIIRERVVYVNRPRTRVREADPVQPTVATVPQTQTQSQPQTTTSTSPSTSQGNGTTASTGEGRSVPVQEEKKGWNNATKDAVIGGVGGMITGAVLSRNKVKGAIIGGVLGAGGGYIFGKSKDKKNASNNENPILRNVNYIEN